MATFAKTEKAYINLDAIQYVEFDYTGQLIMVVHWTNGQKAILSASEAINLAECLDQAVEYAYPLNYATPKEIPPDETP